ncbi:rRNA maturation RNase YbeY [Candidatus Dependentiae bacterium]|nr:MAG: rRNA maturation RNase YbeY [Candidatus Dependentiae bacterium]
MVNIQNNQSIVINQDWLHKIATQTVRFLDYQQFDLSIVLVNNEEMQTYNKQFRGIDKPTDVLSFPFFADAQPGKKLKPTCKDEYVLGDIIIAPLYIQEHLEERQDTFEHRIMVLLVHSICHLLGYDHIEDNDFALMDKEEKRILAHLESVME